MLQHLKSRLDKKPGDERDLNLSHTSLYDLAQKLKISYEEAYEYHFALNQRQHTKTTVLGGKHYVALEENGYAAAIDEFWLSEGQRVLNEKIYDKAKWIVPLLALAITAASLIFSAYTTQQTKRQIEIISADLQKLRVR
jgi:hypothetical protein